MSLSLKLFLLVAGGGALGASLRYAVALALKPNFLWATLSVNLLGSFLIGVLFAMTARTALPETMRLFLGVGLLGGFTTFSAFSLELLQLLERRDIMAAALYAGGSLFGGLALVALGYFIARGMVS